MNLETEVLFYRIKKNYRKTKKKYDKLKESFAQKWDEVDGLYRVYHHSWKMYNELQSAISSYLQVFLELIREKKGKKETLKWEIKKLGLDPFFSLTIQEALELDFSRNEEKIWHKDQKTLTSALYHAKTAINSIMSVAEKYVKRGELPGEEGLLDIDESVFVEMLDLRDYRWTPIKDTKKRIKEYETKQKRRKK